MLRKVSFQVLVLALLLLTFFGTPFKAHAGGVCGGAYIVEAGDTPEIIAAMCGTSASAIYAANPGVSGALRAGQIITVPGANYLIPGVPIATATNTSSYPPAGYSNTYVVQTGDTFASIASRYGVSTYNLWTANQNIADINALYVGQVISVPAVFGQPTYQIWAAIVTTSSATPSPLSYGAVPVGTVNGTILLVNKSNGDVYVSLRGTTRDGNNIIREYPVNGTMEVKAPAGWYAYVAWVGGQKFEGQFNLPQEADHSITFYSNKVSVE